GPFRDPAGPERGARMRPALETLAVSMALLPLFAALGAFVIPRAARIVGLGAAALLPIDAALLATRVADRGIETRIEIGGWPAPLGIALAIDGLTALMLLTTALASAGVLVYAGRYFAHAERAAAFMPLALLLVTGLNVLFLSADLFNLYFPREFVRLPAARSLVATWTAG